MAIHLYRGSAQLNTQELIAVKSLIKEFLALNIGNEIYICVGSFLQREYDIIVFQKGSVAIIELKHLPGPINIRANRGWIDIESSEIIPSATNPIGQLTQQVFRLKKELKNRNLDISYVHAFISIWPKIHEETIIDSNIPDYIKIIGADILAPSLIGLPPKESALTPRSIENFLHSLGLTEINLSNLIDLLIPRSPNIMTTLQEIKIRPIPYVDRHIVIKDSKDNRQEIQENEFVDSLLSNQSDDYFALIGESGVGKTAFLFSLRDRIISKNVPVLICRASAWNHQSDFVTFLAKEQLFFGIRISEIDILHLLMDRTKKPILIIDAINELPDTSNLLFEDLSRLKTTLGSIRYIISSKPGFKLPEIYSWKIIQLERLNDKELDSLMSALGLSSQVGILKEMARIPFYAKAISEFKDEIKGVRQYDIISNAIEKKIINWSKFLKLSDAQTYVVQKIVDNIALKLCEAHRTTFRKSWFDRQKYFALDKLSKYYKTHTYSNLFLENIHSFPDIA
jgi:hypothetical protein